MSPTLTFESEVNLNKQLNSETWLCNTDTVPYLSYSSFINDERVLAGFSTRLGGVSKGYFSSMNLGFERGDEKESVMENFKLISASAGFDMKKTVLTNQWHTVNVRYVDETLCGEGIFSPRTEESIDGQITDKKGITLFAYGADCPPVYLFDEKNVCIGLSHSGWKGTLNSITYHTIEKMKERFGTEPQHIRALVGPGICSSCYEIGEDVAEQFRNGFRDYEDVLMPSDKPGKYYLDLIAANRINLLNANVLEENIAVSGYCTKCHPDMLFSHRAHGSDRGSCAAFMMIRN